MDIQFKLTHYIREYNIRFFRDALKKHGVSTGFWTFGKSDELRNNENLYDVYDIIIVLNVATPDINLILGGLMGITADTVNWLALPK